MRSDTTRIGRHRKVFLLQSLEQASVHIERHQGRDQEIEVKFWQSFKSPLIPYKKDDSPSPVTYKDVDKNWKKMSTYRNTSNHVYTIKKESKRSFLDETLKMKSKVPQVGHYKDSMNSYLMLSKGT